MKFEIIFCEDLGAVKFHIKSCEGRHIQQVAYSSYHDALTQVCFNCQLIRTSLDPKELIKTDKIP